MARESIITILRSLSADTPTGLTFGEFGFAGASRKLFVGGTGGGATVESVWIGASITGESLNAIGSEVADLWPNGQDGNNTLSTSRAIKNYVDAVAGTKGEVISVNDDTGIITITGAGNNAAVVVRRTAEDTHLIDARIATESVTGVAYFNVSQFAVTPNGGVSLKQGTTFVVRGSDGSSDTVGLTGTLTLTGGGALRINAGVGNVDNNATVTFDPRIASASLTGVASFDPRHFAIGLSGHVSLTGSIGADSVRMASATVTGAASFDPRHFALGLSGHVSLTGTYQVTGDTVVAGNSISVSRSNNQATITNAGVTGITSGTVTYANIGTNGIFLSGTTGNISIQNTGVRSLSVLGSGVTADWYQKGPQIQGDGFNINVSAGYGDVPTATNPYLRISSSGLYSLNGLTSGSSLEGPFLNITGDGGAIRAVNNSNTATITFVPRIATASLTGVASFDPRHFAIGLSGHVSLTGSYQVTGHTVVSGGASQLVSISGNIATIDNRIATASVTGVASFGNNFQISSVGLVELANDVTIAGNLTVQGTVVTANVDNFTVKDTLIKLGTGNNTPGAIKDLGLYMQYPVAATDIRLAGFFLDYEDTKFKLFTGLTTGAQDGLSGTDVAARLNTDRQGYTVATLIARLDGGTF
jgi:hypothetical protein